MVDRGGSGSKRCRRGDQLAEPGSKSGCGGAGHPVWSYLGGNKVGIRRIVPAHPTPRSPPPAGFIQTPGVDEFNHFRRVRGCCKPQPERKVTRNVRRKLNVACEEALKSQPRE